jgi:hypothetical protein
MKRIKYLIIFLVLSMITVYSVQGNTVKNEKRDSICTHGIVRGTDGKILSWYKPEINGASYDHVIKLAYEFIKNVVPCDPKSGLKLYYLYCEIQGPESGSKTIAGCGGSNNPSCVFAGLTESLAVKYRIYSGDESYRKIIKDCLDHMLQHGNGCSHHRVQ